MAVTEIFSFVAETLLRAQTPEKFFHMSNRLGAELPGSAGELVGRQQPRLFLNTDPGIYSLLRLCNI